MLKTILSFVLLLNFAEALAEDVVEIDIVEGNVVEAAILKKAADGYSADLNQDISSTGGVPPLVDEVHIVAPPADWEEGF